MGRVVAVQLEQVRRHVRDLVVGARELARFLVVLLAPREVSEALQLLQAGRDRPRSVGAGSDEVGDGYPPAVPVCGDQTENAFGLERQPPVTEQRVRDLSEVVPGHLAAPDSCPVAHRTPPVTLAAWPVIVRNTPVPSIQVGRAPADASEGLQPHRTKALLRSRRLHLEPVRSDLPRCGSGGARRPGQAGAFAFLHIRAVGVQTSRTRRAPTC